MIRAVVMGASAGGIEAIQNVIHNLPSDFAPPIFIVLHVHPDSYTLVHLFENSSPIPLRDGTDRERIENNRIYLAPPDYHMLVEMDGTISLCVAERVNHARPAIDPLFQSAADCYGNSLAAVVLSGAYRDGADGMADVKAKGGVTIVQDPGNAQVSSMPNAAIEKGKPDWILTDVEIATCLTRLSRS